jgi:hypothetical protein
MGKNFDYLIATNADISDIEVIAIEGDDSRINSAPAKAPSKWVSSNAPGHH